MDTVQCASNAQAWPHVHQGACAATISARSGFTHTSPHATSTFSPLEGGLPCANPHAHPLGSGGSTLCQPPHSALGGGGKSTLCQLTHSLLWRGVGVLPCAIL